MKIIMNNLLNIRCKTRSLKSVLIAFCMLMLVFTPSCLDDPMNIDTFHQERMGEFLENRDDQFSEFVNAMKATDVLGLINAYGDYTLFAPTNEAMFQYYKEKGLKSYKDLHVDSLRKIVYDHIIKGFEVPTQEFLDGLMPFLTMSDRFVSTTSRTEGNTLFYFVNDRSKIISRNNIVSNGIIHVVDRVLDPSTLNIIQAVAEDKRFSLFVSALFETGVAHLLTKTRDENYDPKNYSHFDVTFVQGGGSVDELPVSRKYGFTILMTSDETYRERYGIETLDQLKAYVAQRVYHENPADALVTNPKDPRNSLYKYVAYHCINKKLTYHQFIEAYDTDHMIKTFDMFEYIETMSPNTLMEVKLERGSVLANAINMIPETGEAVRIKRDYKDKDAINGVYHEIDRMLIYDASVVAMLSSKRLRMDAATFFPELTNNNMRYYDPTRPRSWVFPPGYIERLTATENTRFCYLNAFGGYLNFQGDEIYLRGMYHFTLETPPIPAGTYEIRFGYQPTGGRGAAQLYWNSVPTGIPLDLRILANDPLVGFVEPGTDPDDPFGFENDKMMRNRGYMKGPSTFRDVLGVWYGRRIARNSPQYLRRILGTFTFETTRTHFFTVKAVREGQFMMDFLEFVPIEMIEFEDVE